MMLKAVFIDFYGTLVHEDGPIPDRVLDIAVSTAGRGSRGEIFARWWQYFSGYMAQANSGPFRSQYDCARDAFADAVAEFGSAADPDELCGMMVQHWSHPRPYPDAGGFAAALKLPYYIVTNGDSVFFDTALDAIGVRPAAVISSERAGAYKPDTRIFQAALQAAGLAPDEVIHIGDSAENDYEAARRCGIRSVLLDRAGTAAAGLSPVISRLDGLFSVIPGIN